MLDTHQFIDVSQLKKNDLVADVDSIELKVKKKDYSYKDTPKDLQGNISKIKKTLDDDYFNIPVDFQEDKKQNCCIRLANWCLKSPFMFLAIFFSRLTMLADIASDIYVDILLYRSNDIKWATALSVFISASYFLCWMTTTSAFIMNKKKLYQIIAWIIFGIPCLFFLDVFFLIRYPCSAPIDSEILSLLRMRNLSEVFLESVPQLCLQTYIYIKLNTLFTIDGTFLLLSIIFSICSVIRNIWVILHGARLHGISPYSYLQSIFLTGMGLIPHLDALEDNMLSVVDYSPIQLSLSQIKILGTALASPKITSLDKLILNNNKIGNKGLQYMSDFLSLNSSLSHLSLVGNEIDDITPLVTSIRSNHKSKLTVIDISNNNIGDEGTEIISKLLEENRLIRLSIACNDISQDGIRYLSSTLANNNSLTHLNISYNIIGDEGIKYISNSLKMNTTLTTLIMISTNFGDKGLIEIADALTINQSIKVLDISSPKEQLGLGLRKYLSKFTPEITNEGISILASSLQKNISLSSIFISGGANVDIDVKMKLAASLKHDNRGHIGVVRWL